ncbi:hypothetical protein ACFDR9_002147 [Janthinobacterium sp. CG_23.3]|uniref:hypothetical protein n=1 Tax=unclassified Janthinobacterium TaxID=2610881 RepID=UPI002DF73393|nr:hypothetical protein [Janthinobacterium sp. CG_S6]
MKRLAVSAAPGAPWAAPARADAEYSSASRIPRRKADVRAAGQPAATAKSGALRRF